MVFLSFIQEGGPPEWAKRIMFIIKFPSACLQTVILCIKQLERHPSGFYIWEDNNIMQHQPPQINIRRGVFRDNSAITHEIPSFIYPLHPANTVMWTAANFTQFLFLSFVRLAVWRNMASKHQRKCSSKRELNVNALNLSVPDPLTLLDLATGFSRRVNDTELCETPQTE